MDPIFEQFIISMEDKYQTLINSEPKQRKDVPKEPGIYLFSQDDAPLYVGRTNNL